MKKFLFSGLLTLLLLASFIAGSRYGQTPRGNSGGDSGRRILYYVDPMNPANISDKPGTAPCGMALEPVYEESDTPSYSIPAGAVRINAEKQQLIGVRSGPVEMSGQTMSIRTLGRIAPDENRVYTVTSAGSGWIWDVFGSTTGEIVKKDQVLATFYDKSFFGAEQSYFFGLDFVTKADPKSDKDAPAQSKHSASQHAQSTASGDSKSREDSPVGEKHASHHDCSLPAKPSGENTQSAGETATPDTSKDTVEDEGPHVRLAHGEVKDITMPREMDRANDAAESSASVAGTLEPEVSEEQESALEDYENMNMQGWASSEPVLSPYTTKASGENKISQAVGPRGADARTSAQSNASPGSPLERPRMAEVRAHQKYIIDQAESAVHNLIDLGMSDTQIRELTRTREWTSRIEIRSPATGHVISRDIYQGLRFDRGAEFFRIADLTRVWVVADVFEREALHIKPGDRAIVTVPKQATSWEAKVSEVLPIFDPDTRTFKVRLETDNPDFVLKPDMFVDVEFLVNTASAISVPVDAIINSGMRKTVFVDLGNGFFEPREVKAGPHSGGKVQITEGLMPGEKIVLSGAFLLDSETQMKRAAARKLTAGVKDPVCGMSIDPGKAKASGLTSESGGKTYFFCEPSCKANFDRDLAGKLPGEQAKASQSAQNDSAASPGARARNEAAAKNVEQPRAATLIR